MRIGNKPVGVLARPAAVALAKQVRRPVRRRRRVRMFLIIAAFIAIGGATPIVARTWPNAWPNLLSFEVAKKPEAAPPKRAGQIIIPRSHSELCDRFSFDNKNGAMRTLEASPCHKREDVKIVDQVNSFSSSWRGAR
jgi:hypothetical protein